jgi:hypothetical protein
MSNPSGAGAGWVLQSAVYTLLVANAALTAALGGPKVYDDVPRRVDFPFVTFGPATEEDWSTSTEAGREHIFTLNAWSRGAGRSEAVAIAAAVEAALQDAALTLNGFALVTLHHQQTTIARTSDGETFNATVRFRAVTEPV